MFSFISSLSSSVYLYIIATLLSISLVTSGLLYWQIGKTADAEAALVSAINANTSLQKSLNLRDLSCKVDDAIATEYQIEKTIINQEKDKELASIDKLPSKPVQAPSTKAVSNESKSNVVNIDDALPDDLTRLLTESYNRVSGHSDSSSR